MRGLKDWAGQRVGALTITHRADNGPDGKPRWHCVCDCGKATIGSARLLASSQKTSCGCGIYRSLKKAADLAGQRFGKLTAIRLGGPNKPGRSKLWICKCDCGGERTTSALLLKSGGTTSCGCARRKHNLTAKPTPTFYSWRNMIARCKYPSAIAHAHYKKRGIDMCERWMEYENFVADMGERPPNTTIERKDNNRGYEPGNCRWATKREQANNRITNNRFKYQGKEYTLADLVRATGASKETLRYRLVRPGGWSVKDAVETPTIPRHLRKAGMSKRKS
jgi:hypothetical protein